MTALTSILPITVVAAVSLFIVKELLEGYRRWHANRRKRMITRTLLAFECERNHWSIKSMRRIVEDMQENQENMCLKKDVSGQFLFRIERSGRLWSQKPIPTVHKTYFDRYLIDVALVDRYVFQNLLSTYDAILELEHIRKGILDYSQPSDVIDVGDTEGFSVYALRVLDDAYAALDKFYQRCSGKKLDVHRLR